ADQLNGAETARSLSAIEADLRRAAEGQIAALVDNADALRAEETDLRAALRSDLLQADLPTDLLSELYRIQQDVSVARSQYQSLLARLRDVEVQAGMQVADSRIVSPALAPSGASFPNRRVVLGAAIIAALGAGVILAFLREFFVGGFSTAAHLQDAIGAPVASTMPFTGLTSTEATLADKIVNAPLSAYSEAVRRLRASIDQAIRQQPRAAGKTGKVLLVASTLPGEGKSTTALALARTYAVSGKSVLLIDCDLRKPGIHRLLGVEPHGGFLDYLREGEDAPNLRDFSGVDPYSDLTVVLGKARSALPTDQLLTSARFEKLLQGAKQTFDLVVLDSPPLLPVVDGRYIAHHADAVLMVVKWASTGQSEVRSVLGALCDAMSENAVLLGALSHSESRAALSYSGYYGTEHVPAS
ncbi:MAG: GNVR domain-containing protein, partial [Pseudomonadota bacterium]